MDKRIFKIVLIGILAGISGCSAINQSTSRTSYETAKRDLIATDVKYREAMMRFIDGALKDVEGDYASAILDYQDALRFYDDAAIHDAMAQDYIRLNKSDIAVDESQKAVRMAPEVIAYRRTLAQSYLMAFKTDSAIAVYRQILQLDSTSRQDLYVLAQLLQQKNPVEAEALYERILRLNGPDMQTLMQLLRIYNETQQFDRAIHTAKEMLRVDPDNPMLRQMLADVYMETDSYDSALAIIRPLMITHPDDLNLKAKAATIYLRMKNFNAADSLLNLIFTSDSSRADAKFSIAQFYLNEMRADSTVVPFAREIFSKLIKLFPKDPRSYFIAGLGASYAGDDSSAVRFLTKSLSIDSLNSDAWQALGVVYFQTGRFNEMDSTMSRAVKIFPNDFRINLFLGIALNREGKNEEAVSPLEKAVSLNPSNMDALSTLALVYESIHKYDDAYRVYETALKLDSTNALILNNYAYSLSERNLNLEKALSMAKKAIAADPKNSAYLDTIGWIYFKLGDYKKASAYVREALSLRTAADGSPAVLEEHLGDIYMKLGDKKQAIEYWKRALEHNPTNSALKEKIEKLKP
ncbi:MAG: tetratricopeptide repeat protein [Candidatus Kryptoniota bacterium]